VRFIYQNRGWQRSYNLGYLVSLLCALSFRGENTRKYFFKADTEFITVTAKKVEENEKAWLHHIAQFGEGDT
jgi:hypothetical protein